MDDSRRARKVHSVRMVEWWLVVAFGAILAGTALWIRQNWGPITYEQMLLNLPRGGAEPTAAVQTYMRTWFQRGIITPLAIVALLAVTVTIVRRRRLVRERIQARKTGAPRPLVLRPLRWRIALLPPLIGGLLFAQTVGIPQHLSWLTSDVSIQPYYAAPAPTPHDQPLNLVVIYLESIESEMGDASQFEENMLQPLDDATAGWASIDNLTVPVGGGWTMAGIVGTECGLLLRDPGVRQFRFDDLPYKAPYMPGAVCLGDVLADQGYTNAYIGGADGNFAEKDRFLRTHGYESVEGLANWTLGQETEIGTWGLSDRRMLEHAKEEVTKLHDADKPFHLSLLTLDSHEPGHLWPSCQQTTQEVMTSIIRCSMSEVASFVDYMKQQGYLEDTVVVITGDHPKMVWLGGAFQEQLGDQDRYSRPLYNRIYSPHGVTIARETADQLSMFATILDLMGYGSPDHRAGLGVSTLVSDTPSPSMLDLSDDDYNKVMQSRSAGLYRELWSPSPVAPQAVARDHGG